MFKEEIVHKHSIIIIKTKQKAINKHSPLYDNIMLTGCLFLLIKPTQYEAFVLKAEVSFRICKVEVAKMATGGDENHFQCRKIDSKQAKRKKANGKLHHFICTFIVARRF